MSVSLYTKLLDIQAEIGTLKKGATNPFYNSSYIEINGVLQALLPVFQERKLLLLQPLDNLEGKPAITTLIIDTESGESIQNTTLITEVADAQKMGGSVTYWRRYCLISLLGLGAEDDDGNSLVKKPGKSVGKPAPKAKSPGTSDRAVRSNSF